MQPKMDVPVIDLYRICRVCKGEAPDMRSVFEPLEITDENPRIDEMLMACAAVQVKAEDELPSLICSGCAEQLKNAYAFRRLCQETDISLRQYVKDTKAKDIKQEAVTDSFYSESTAETTATASRIEGPTKPAQESASDYIELLENNQMLLSCRECGKMFTTLEGLRSHKRIHLGTLFNCKYCGKGYTRQTHVHRHELSHGKHKLHVCRICNKTLTRMEHLKRHLTTHLKEKPFACKSCNRGFNRSDHLDVHALRCKGERVHICDICNRGFTREDSLEVHKRIHDNQKPVLPTLDNIDNIEEHYYQIDHDPNADYAGAANSDVEDCFEPHVEVTENTDEEKFQEVADDLQNDSNNSSKIEKEEEPEEVKAAIDIDDAVDIKNGNELHEEDEEEEEEEEEEQENKDFSHDFESMEFGDDYRDEATNDVPDNDSESVHSEYLPRRSPILRTKRGRGRPRKHPPKVANSRGRGRPRGRRPVIKKEEPVDEDNNDDEVGQYPCTNCEEVFTRLSHLQKHVKRHETTKIHTCVVCLKEFSRYNHLKRHMSSHSVIKPFSCDVCKKKFSRRDHLQQHARLHEKKLKYECENCMRLFNREDQLAKHRASKHGIGEKIMGEKKYACTMCEKSFTTEKYRDVHIKGHMGDKHYICSICNKCFLSKSHLTEHQKFHNEHSKKFLCSECGQRFVRNDYLVIHMRRHRGEKPFKCKFCGKGFPRTTDLTVHERYHTGEKTHLCTICGRGFGRAYNLTVHMRTHTGEKPYQCSYCDAAFAQGNDLKAHVRRHTGERFQCELCSESFLMGYLLTQHKRSVHGLNVVSNIRRLQPVHKIKEDVDDPPITIPLPKPVVPEIVLSNLQAHLAAAQMHHLARE